MLVFIVTENPTKNEFVGLVLASETADYPMSRILELLYTRIGVTTESILAYMRNNSGGNQSRIVRAKTSKEMMDRIEATRGNHMYWIYYFNGRIWTQVDYYTTTLENGRQLLYIPDEYKEEYFETLGYVLVYPVDNIRRGDIVLKSNANRGIVALEVAGLYDIGYADDTNIIDWFEVTAKCLITAGGQVLASDEQRLESVKIPLSRIVDEFPAVTPVPFHNYFKIFRLEE